MHVDGAPPPWHFAPARSAPVHRGLRSSQLGTTEFCWMTRVSALFAAVVALSTPVWAAELPDGPNRALVASRCTECHDLQMVFDAAGISREDWNGAIEEMTSYGLKMTPEERNQILDYLATYLGPSAKK
jgi:hypothetical protein